MQKILLIDNFDSFTYNLLHYLQQCNCTVEVVRNNQVKILEKIEKFDKIVISPGPSTPQNSGFTKKLVKGFHKNKAFLGICLGMQIINEVFAGRTIKAPFAVHGKSSVIKLNNESLLFSNLPQQISVARYHSLICADIADEFLITSTYFEIPMSFEHKKYMLYGTQFHPESFLTEYGLQIIENFVGI